MKKFFDFVTFSDAIWKSNFNNVINNTWQGFQVQVSQHQTDLLGNQIPRHIVVVFWID